MGMRPIPIEDRFWKNVKKTDFCWEWIGAKMTRGYGQILYKGKDTGAHRVSLIISGRKIPKGYDVMHICDNKSCVNPAHLKAVPHRENMIDFSDKYSPISDILKEKEGDDEVLRAFKKLVVSLGGIPRATKHFKVTRACIYQKLSGWSQITGDMLAASGYKRTIKYEKIKS